jgi:hypothetical protein
MFDSSNSAAAPQWTVPIAAGKDERPNWKFRDRRAPALPTTAMACERGAESSETDPDAAAKGAVA